MSTAVDTNALLAILYEDGHTAASEAALRRAYQEGRVVATPIVYAELAADGYFDTADELDQLTSASKLRSRLEPLASRQGWYSSATLTVDRTDYSVRPVERSKPFDARTVMNASHQGSISPLIFSSVATQLLTPTH